MTSSPHGENTNIYRVANGNPGSQPGKAMIPPQSPALLTAVTATHGISLLTKGRAYMNRSLASLYSYKLGHRCAPYGCTPADREYASAGLARHMCRRKHVHVGHSRHQSQQTQQTPESASKHAKQSIQNKGSQLPSSETTYLAAAPEQRET